MLPFWFTTVAWDRDLECLLNKGMNWHVGKIYGNHLKFAIQRVMFTSYNPCSFTELICVASSTFMVTQHFSCKAVFLACCCHGIIFKHQDFDWARVSTCGSCRKPQKLPFTSSQFFVGVRLLLWGLGQSQLDQECGTFLNMVAMWVIFWFMIGVCWEGSAHTDGHVW